MSFIGMTTGAEKTGRLRSLPGPGTTSSSLAGWPSSTAAAEARELIWAHRHRLALGLTLMVINRVSGMVVPATTKWPMDDVIGRQQWDRLPRLAMIAGAATLVASTTSFWLSQVLGVAAQRAITDIRKQVQAHVLQLPIRHLDSTKTGILISRIMSDPDGVRHLIGTGLVQLIGAILTALASLGVLLEPSLSESPARVGRRSMLVRTPGLSKGIG